MALEEIFVGDLEMPLLFGCGAGGVQRVGRTRRVRVDTVP